jgi:hypothetical protein
MAHKINPSAIRLKFYAYILPRGTPTEQKGQLHSNCKRAEKNPRANFSALAEASCFWRRDLVQIPRTTITPAAFVLLQSARLRSRACCLPTFPARSALAATFDSSCFSCTALIVRSNTSIFVYFNRAHSHRVYFFTNDFHVLLTMGYCGESPNWQPIRV